MLFIPKKPQLVCLVFTGFLYSSALFADELSLSVLETSVLKSDAMLKALGSKSRALSDEVKPAGELPDPRISFSARNIPLDSFNFDQEAMTQAVVGISQHFPAGDTREIKTELAEIKAQVGSVAINQNRIRLLKQVRKHWLEVYASEARLRLLSEKVVLQNEQLRTLEVAYQSGRTTKRQVSAMQLELTAEKNAEQLLKGENRKHRAELARWIEAAITDQWPLQLPPVLSSFPSNEISESHPDLQVLTLKKQQAYSLLQLEKQGYEPGWALESSYGWRDGRADFLSVGMSMDLRLSKARRIDPKVSAAAASVETVSHELQNQHSEFTARLASLLAVSNALDEQIALYRSDIIPQRKEQIEFSRIDYESGRGDLNAYFSSRLAVVKSRRQLLDLQIKKAFNTIEALYLNAGEQS